MGVVDCIGSNMNKTMIQKCEGWDLNPRTPTRQNLKSCTVGQALLPSQLIGLYFGNNWRGYILCLKKIN